MNVKKTIFISGFMGTGKSTVGRILAQKLGIPFVDTDTLIEQKWDLGIATIFSKKGETFFRKEETRLLVSLSTSNPRVVSLGGGIPLKFENREILRRGIWINLQGMPATIFKRVAPSTKRPLLGKKPSREKMEGLLKQRRPFYDLAPIQIQTDGLAPDAVTEMIVQRIR